ncbi:MAG: hypothetical protein JXA67_17455 [Micromonosporaceae bacterium]|nr:hypothetical protein [Micromonosporaceae bacterium]
MESQTTDLAQRLSQCAHAVFERHVPAPNTFEIDQPIGYELRTRFDKDLGHVRRLVVYMRGTLCDWSRKGGGCVYCGFYRATNGGVRIPDDACLNQINQAYQHYIDLGADSVGIYNDGSFLNPAELSESAQHAILETVASWPGIKSVTIETRGSFVTRAAIERCLRILRGVRLEVCLGIDSLDPSIQGLVTNRGVRVDATIRKLQLLKELGCGATALMVYKLPFLTESETFDDLLGSITRLTELGINVDLEAMTVQSGSVLELLHQEGLYRPPWIWSIIELLRAAPDPKSVYLSPFSYSVMTKDVPRNCQHCSEDVKRELFDRYELSRDAGDLPQLRDCCVATWREEFTRDCETSLEARVAQHLARIEGRIGCRA